MLVGNKRIRAATWIVDGVNGALESPDQELSFYASVDVNDPYATTLWAWKVWAVSAAIVPIMVPSTNYRTKYQLQYQVPNVVPSTNCSTKYQT